LPRYDKAADNPINDLPVSVTMTDLGRYARQTRMPQIGEEGQRMLLDADVLVVGGGALGNVIASLMVRAGVGKLTVIDRDVVSLDNLHRQPVFIEKDVGRPKAAVLEERLGQANSDIQVKGVADDFNWHNAGRLTKGRSVVMDGTDNMLTRYIINDACVKQRVPWIYGGAVATYGMVMNVLPGQACFRCLYPTLPPEGTLPTCETAGVIGPTPAAIASIQVAQAFRVILGNAQGGKLFIHEPWALESHSVLVPRKQGCKTCGKGEYEFLNADKRELVTRLCGSDSIQIVPASRTGYSLESLAERLEGVVEFSLAEVLSFEAEGCRVNVFPDGRTLVEGTTDESKARGIFSKYIGN